MNRGGYQPNGKLNENDPPRGGSGMPRDDKPNTEEVVEPQLYDPQSLKKGFIIGIGDDDKLFYSNCGKEKPSIYELIGFAYTAQSILEYVRDHGGVPSFNLDFMEIKLAQNSTNKLIADILKIIQTKPEE
jgi:hypothetical protein